MILAFVTVSIPAAFFASFGATIGLLTVLS